MIETRDLAFPKPSDMVRVKPEAVHKYPGGREICRVHIKEGKREYRGRVSEMLERQSGRCCLEGWAPMCPGPLDIREATFEHEWGRGGGKQDDRIELPDGTLINGAAHFACNGWKGSRYIDYNCTIRNMAQSRNCATQERSP